MLHIVPASQKFVAMRKEEKNKMKTAGVPGVMPAVCRTCMHLLWHKYNHSFMNNYACEDFGTLEKRKKKTRAQAHTQEVDQRTQRNSSADENEDSHSLLKVRKASASPFFSFHTASCLASM